MGDTDNIMDNMEIDKTPEKPKEGYWMIDSERQLVVINGDKQKVIKETKYKNGIKKRTLIGVRKDGKTLFDRGVNWDKV